MASEPGARPSARDVCEYEVVRRAWEAMEVGRRGVGGGGVVEASATLQVELLSSAFDLTYLLSGHAGVEIERGIVGVVEGMDSFGFGSGMDVDESF